MIHEIYFNDLMGYVGYNIAVRIECVVVVVVVAFGIDVIVNMLIYEENDNTNDWHLTLTSNTSTNQLSSNLSASKV